MPKKFTAHEKAEWLEHYEAGKTEAWIARNVAHCDVRTIKRGIEEARRQKEVKAARVEMVKEALQKHQEDLLTTLAEVLSELRVPEADLAALPWEGFDRMDAGVLSGRQAMAIEGKATWDLLREHLKRDPLWRLLTQRQKALATYLEVNVALQHKVLALLGEKLGCRLVGRKGTPTPPYAYISAVGPVLFGAAVRGASGTSGGEELEDRLNTDLASGEVKYGGATTLSKVPGSEEEFGQRLGQILSELQGSQEVRDVVAAHGQLEEATAKARQAVEEALLLRLIPGQCRICRRLGM